MTSKRIPLTQGSYTARSVIADAQRCINLYPEKNPSDAEQPFTLYLTPGLTPLGEPATTGLGRGLYRATNGQLFAFIGTGIYYVASDWTTTLLGTTANNTNMVKANDNGTTMVVVDGSSAGYTVDLTTHAYAVIGDPNFYGSNFVEDLDTYLLFNKPGTAIFYCSDSNDASTYNPLFFAAKSGYSDLLSGVAVQQRYIWLVGQLTTEMWTDVGASDFPFQLFTGPFVENGNIATYSLAKMGGSVFFLSQNQEGSYIVLQTQGYTAQPITTDAISNEWNGYSTVTDAIGFCYEQLGHSFYWIKFPTAGKDWVYDLTTKLWHERAYLNPSTCGLELHRVQATAWAYNTVVGLDYNTGQLYALDPYNYTDAGAFIWRQRGYPHLVDDGKRVVYSQFIADMEAGDTTGAGVAVPVLPNDTDVPVFEFIDVTFTAPNGTFLENYFALTGLIQPGGQFTQIDMTSEGVIENNMLSGSGGKMCYLSSGVATAADYILMYQVVPVGGYGAAPPSGNQLYVIGRAVPFSETTGYRGMVYSDGSQFQLELDVMPTTGVNVVAMGLPTSGYFQIIMSMTGNQISLWAQRTQDNNWLAPNGSWQATAVAAITLTDSTYTATGRVMVGGNF